MKRNFAEHARVTAICVNLALDAVEADIREVLVSASPEVSAILHRLLKGLKDRRVNHSEMSAGTPLVM
jgi:hypothetical protein